MFSLELKIPKSRVAVLIGQKGEIKRLIERKTKAKLKVSSEGDVLIESGDNIHSFNARPIVLAIGRGFNPDTALTLLDENFGLEILSIKDYTKSEKDRIRLRSRLIGTNGKARKMLERMTDTFISIQGNTIAIIGRLEAVDLALRAVEKLLKGAPHGNTYKFIELQKKKDAMLQ